MALEMKSWLFWERVFWDPKFLWLGWNCFESLVFSDIARLGENTARNWDLPTFFTYYVNIPFLW